MVSGVTSSRSRGLSLRPASRRAQLQDREPFDRRVVRPALRRDALHPRVLDSDLFTEKRDLASKAVVLGLESDAGAEVVLRAAPGYAEGDGRHRDGVDDCGPDVAGPALGNPLFTARVGRDHADLEPASPEGACTEIRSSAKREPPEPDARILDDDQRPRLELASESLSDVEHPWRDGVCTLIARADEDNARERFAGSGEKITEVEIEVSTIRP